MADEFVSELPDLSGLTLGEIMALPGIDEIARRYLERCERQCDRACDCGDGFFELPPSETGTPSF